MLIYQNLSIWSGYFEFAKIRHIHVSEIFIWLQYLTFAKIRYIHVSDISIWSGYVEFAKIRYIYISEVSIWSGYLIGYIPRREEDYSLWMCLTLSGLCWEKKTGIYTRHAYRIIILFLWYIHISEIL